MFCVEAVNPFGPVHEKLKVPDPPLIVLIEIDPFGVTQVLSELSTAVFVMPVISGPERIATLVEKLGAGSASFTATKMLLSTGKLPIVAGVLMVKGTVTL